MSLIRKILIILFIAAAASVANAQQIDSGTISSGGALELQGGGVSLQDIKGQSAAGVVR